jgi:hypothetical protein
MCTVWSRETGVGSESSQHKPHWSSSTLPSFAVQVVNKCFATVAAHASPLRYKMVCGSRCGPSFSSSLHQCATNFLTPFPTSALSLYL